MADPANPYGRVTGPWERVVDDTAATAARYREAGGTVVECHPGDVATVTEGERRGLDVVLAGDEFEQVRSVLASPVDGIEVFRATGNDLVLLLLAVDADAGVVLLPAYYERSDIDALREVAADGLPVHARPLDSRQVVTLTVDGPDSCFPE